MRALLRISVTVVLGLMLVGALVLLVQRLQGRI